MTPPGRAAGGASRADAEAIASSITEANCVALPRGRDAVTLGDYLTHTWLPERQRRVRATTAYRYGWIIERYIVPTVGRYALRSIRTEHLNALYAALSASGGQHGDGLAAKTVHEVHLIVRSPLTQTTEQGLTRTTSRCAHSDRDRIPVRAAARRHRPPTNSPPSWTPLTGIACTRRCISPLPPGCAAARSPDCAGATGTPACTNCRSAAPVRHWPGDPPRYAPVDAASNSTSTPSTSSNAGATANATTDTTSERKIRCSPTPAANHYTRSRSVSRQGSHPIRSHLCDEVIEGPISLPASRSPADATTLDRLAAGFSGKASNGTTRHSPDSLRRRSCAHHTTRSSASPSRGSLVSSLRQLKHSATRGVASRIGEFIARGASLGRPPDHRKNVLGQEIGRDGK